MKVEPHTTNSTQSPASTFTDMCMAALVDHSASVADVLHSCGAQPVRAYVQESVEATCTPLQDRYDFVSVVKAQSAELFGHQTADAVGRDLDELPAVLTANHHGVDYFAQSVQGTILFAERKVDDVKRARTVPVLACGVIPLDNLTYPMGMLIYDALSATGVSLPRRVPIFSNKARRKLVCAAPPIDTDMVNRAMVRLTGMMKAGELNPRVAEQAIDILETDYAADDVQSLHSYSDQACVLNKKLWRRMQAAEDTLPDLVYLELERIAIEVLLADMLNPSSLFARLVFHDASRLSVAAALDGEGACWDSEQLFRRLADTRGDGSPRSAGTMFFWALSERGRRVPLVIREREGGVPELLGKDDRGISYVFEFSPQALCEAVLAGTLVPSLFSAFTVLALARGITCAGGYYQSVYLPKMQQAAATALAQVQADEAAAMRVWSVPVKTYLSGMQAVMHEGTEGALYPSGPIEIASAGGLRLPDLETVGNMSIAQAHMASLLETIPDLGMGSLTDGAWQQRLAREARDYLDAPLVCGAKDSSALPIAV